jgi:hypothetical protein
MAMFGRLRGYFKKTDRESHDLYRKTYCGACYALDRRFGPKGRLLLSYELVAAFALIGSLMDSEFGLVSNSCPLRGFGKRDRFVFDNSSVNDLLDLYIIYLKASDDESDEKGLRRILASIFKSAIKKEINGIEKKLIENGFPVTNAKELVTQRNHVKINWLDESLNQSSELIGFFAAYIADRFGFENCKSEIVSLGHNLGRCIDLIDMIEDLHSDLKHHRFNPIVELYRDNSHDSKKLLQIADNDLKYLASELSCDLAISLDNLPLRQNSELVRGIFGRSIEFRFRKILHIEEQCECKHKEVYT